MPPLTDVPIELLLDNLLPFVPTSDLLHLASTNRFFATLCNDDTFWKRKLQEDFNFSGAGTARTSGWKFIYKGLSNPRVFVWGQQTNGRLGLDRHPKGSFMQGVPVPTELRLPGIRVVSLTAGGMSFHALDSNGQVHVWGTLNGTSMALRSDGFSIPEKEAPFPMKLQLPADARSVSCGRLHSAILDANNRIWNFRSWGRPFRLESPLLDGSSSETIPFQLECGWAFTSILTQSGDVCVWWPFQGDIDRIFAEVDEQLNAAGNRRVEATPEGVIPCEASVIQSDPFRLPPIPQRLPELLYTGDTDENRKKETRLIKIAAMNNMIVGLTNKGHVLMFTSLASEETLANGRWEYLPNYSDVQNVQRHPTFSSPEGLGSEIKLEPPERMLITHISAHFNTFTAYSTDASSVVLMGSTETTVDSEPTVIPDLQQKSVISVVLGDYHFGALTSTGKLYTWGGFSQGALGLGNPLDIEVGKPGGFATEQHRMRARDHRFGTPPRVDVPTEVRFDHGLKKPKDRFCFAAAAAGWHTGALVIDLEPGDEDEVEESTSHSADQDTGAVPPYPLPTHGPGEIGILPFRGRGIMRPFRVGFPGRGRRTGRGDGPPDGGS